MYITEIVFFALSHKNNDMDILLLDKCAQNFSNYLLIT